MGSRWLKPVERWFKLSPLPPAGAAVIRAGHLSLGGRPCGFRPGAMGPTWRPQRSELEVTLHQLSAEADETVGRCGDKH